MRNKIRIKLLNFFNNLDNFLQVKVFELINKSKKINPRYLPLLIFCLIVFNIGVGACFWITSFLVFFLLAAIGNILIVFIIGGFTDKE